MRIQNINIQPNSLSFKGGAKSKTATNKSDITFSQKYTPIQSGLSTAGSWFAFGIVFDAVTRKIKFFKSPIKNSLAINSILGVAAGCCTAYKANKNNK